MNEWDLNLKKYNSVAEFHEDYARLFNMPDWYGKNWDAFWDAITGLEPLPKFVKVSGIDSFKAKFPEDGSALETIFNDYVKEIAPYNGVIIEVA